MYVFGKWGEMRVGLWDNTACSTAGRPGLVGGGEAAFLELTSVHFSPPST